MYLAYKPAEQPEQRWHYNPGRLQVPEMKLIEKISGFRWAQFQQELQLGSITALQALVWTYLRRQHPALKVEDVNFYGDEVELIKDLDELAGDLVELEDAAGSMPEADRQAGIAYTQLKLRTAPPAPGKAPTATPADDPVPAAAPAQLVPPTPTEAWTPAPAAVSTPPVVPAPSTP